MESCVSEYHGSKPMHIIKRTNYELEKDFDTDDIVEEVNKKGYDNTMPYTPCEFGQRNDEVLKLQKYLHFVRLITKNHITSYYGTITAKAVLKLQLDMIPDNAEGVPHKRLKEWGGRYWGKKSIEFFKKHQKRAQMDRKKMNL